MSSCFLNSLRSIIDLCKIKFLASILLMRQLFRFQSINSCCHSGKLLAGISWCYSGFPINLCSNALIGQAFGNDIIKTAKCLIVGLIIVLPTLLFSQSDYRIVRPSLNDQLSNNYIYSMHQDYFGFMWFGTDGGLMKYDGYNITEYVNDPDDPNSLNNNLIYTIYEDPSDSGTVLWLGTSSGLVKFDRLSGKFVQFTKTTDRALPFPEEAIQSICKDRNGYYWLGGKSFVKFDRNPGKFSYHLKEIEQLFIYSICEDKFGVLWLGTSLGLIKYDPQFKKDKKYTIYPLSTDNPYKTNRNMISSVLEDKKGQIGRASCRERV